MDRMQSLVFDLKNPFDNRQINNIFTKKLKFSLKYLFFDVEQFIFAMKIDF